MSLSWFRLYAETVDDGKLKLLAYEDRWHYVAVLCCKAQGIVDNTKASLLDRTIGAKLGLAIRETDEVKRRLIEVDLIDEQWQPSGWERRQLASDHSLARVRRFREKLRIASESEESETDSEAEADGNVTRNVTETLQKPKARRGTGIPEDFTLTDDRKAYAAERLPNVDAPELFASFRDHHTAKGTIAKDWDASWRTWARNAQKFGYPMVRGPAVSPTPLRRERVEPTQEQITAAQRKAAEDNKRQLMKVIGDVARR